MPYGVFCPHREVDLRGDGKTVKALTELALRTEGFSGSDLNELCSQAATLPVHEALRRRGE
jgi:hypothetical protein